MFGYIGRGYDPTDFAFKETYRVIAAYIEYQKEFDTSKFPEFAEIERKFNVLTQQLDSNLVASIKDDLNGGAHIVPLKELLHGKDFDVQSFFETRHSIRMYQKMPLNQSDIQKAVEIANISLQPVIDSRIKYISHQNAKLSSRLMILLQEAVVLKARRQIIS